MQIKNCKKCIHKDVCLFRNREEDEKTCACFKNEDDFAEVKHGKWIEKFSFGAWHYDCPFCDDGYAVKKREQSAPNYCQNCGAKMKGILKTI